MFGADLVFGTYERTLDFKSRICIPPHFGTEGNELYYLMINETRTKLSIYGVKYLELQYKERKNRLESCNPSDKEQMEKEFEEYCQRIYSGKIDVQHRIVIPQNFLKVIGVEPGEELILTGYGEYIGVTPKKR